MRLTEDVRKTWTNLCFPQCFFMASDGGKEVSKHPLSCISSLILPSDQVRTIAKSSLTYSFISSSQTTPISCFYSWLIIILFPFPCLQVVITPWENIQASSSPFGIKPCPDVTLFSRPVAHLVSSYELLLASTPLPQGGVAFPYI